MNELEAIKARWQERYGQTNTSGYKAPFNAALEDVDTLLQIINAQQAELARLSTSQQKYIDLSEALEQHAPADMVPEITPSLELVQEMGKRLKAQQAAIEAARLVADKFADQSCTADLRAEGTGPGQWRRREASQYRLNCYMRVKGNEMTDMSKATETTLELIQQERQRQDQRWGPPNHPPGEWLLILQEEIGEVCQAVLTDDWDSYRRELIHAAAVLVAMYDQELIDIS